jgi:cell division protein FtsQ
MARVRRLPWRAAAAAALAVAALALGWLWLRDSPFAAVRDVYISGTSSSEEDQVRRALREAARGMSTLHVREEALREAVAPYSSVADIEVHADFPRELAVEVIERRPVATVLAAGRAVPATGAGRLLEGVRAGLLPTVTVEGAGATGQVTDPRALAALRVAAAAPPQLRARAERVFRGPRGLTIDLRDGPDLFFGSPEAAGSKWLAAARVLTEPSAEGAVYLDLRVPGRVAAGGVGPIEPEPTPVVLDPQP